MLIVAHKSYNNEDVGLDKFLFDKGSGNFVSILYVSIK